MIRDDSGLFLWPAVSGLPATLVRLELSRHHRSRELVIRAYTIGADGPMPYGLITTVPCDDDGAPYCTNVLDEFFAKDYEENEGVVDALVEQGIAEIVGSFQPRGAYVYVRRMRLTEAGRALAPQLFGAEIPDEFTTRRPPLARAAKPRRGTSTPPAPSGT